MNVIVSVATSCEAYPRAGTAFHRSRVNPDNIIYLTGKPEDVLQPVPRSCGKGWYLMSTYEELSLIVSVALLIVAILNYTHKK